MFAPPALGPVGEMIEGGVEGNWRNVGLGAAKVFGVPGVIQIDRTLKGKPFGSTAPAPSLPDQNEDQERIRNWAAPKRRTLQRVPMRPRANK